MATHSSILAWRIPWTEEPGKLHSSWGCKKSDTTERLTHSSHVSKRFAICLSNNHLLLGLCKQLGMRNVLACLLTNRTQKGLSKDKTHPSNFKHTNPAISLKMSCTENRPALTTLPLSCIFFFIFWPHWHVGILVSQSGIEHTSPALEMQSLNHWMPREFPPVCYLLVGWLVDWFC